MYIPSICCVKWKVDFLFYTQPHRYPNINILQVYVTYTYTLPAANRIKGYQHKQNRNWLKKQTDVMFIYLMPFTLKNI